MFMRSFRLLPLLAALSLGAAGCGDDGVGNDDGTFPERPGLAVAESDASVAVSFGRLTDALEAAPPVSIVAEVDHAANAASAGLDLRPTRVVLFGNPQLGTPLMQINQQAGLDLPQKMLVYEDSDGQTVVGYNTTDYLAQRHGVDGAPTLDQIASALAMFAGVAAGDDMLDIQVGGATVARDEGVVTAQSANDFETTYSRLRSAISENENLTIVAELNHAANAASAGLELRPTRLIVFGNPALGTQLMQREQTVGIDLPQKMLVYQDAEGVVRVAYNDPAFLADRHDIDGLADVTDTIGTALETLAAAATSEEDG